MKTKAFTLIELLIVVAIIAILAAIAVPNFLEAQTRAKVARSKNDMRTMATALETYRVDNNTYPTDSGQGNGGPAFLIYRPYGPPNTATFPRANFSIGFELTTPIQYLSSVSSLTDVFKLAKLAQYDPANVSGRQYYNFMNIPLRRASNGSPTAFVTLESNVGQWVAFGAGPDLFSNNTQGGIDFSNANSIPRLVNYDATNGTVSNGDIFRSQKYSDNQKEVIPLAPG